LPIIKLEEYLHTLILTFGKTVQCL